MIKNKEEGGECVRKRCNLKCTYKDGAQDCFKMNSLGRRRRISEGEWWGGYQWRCKKTSLVCYLEFKGKKRVASTVHHATCKQL